MNHRVKSNNSENSRYKSVYFKKLQTQNSMSNESLQNFQSTSYIIEKQLKKISYELKKKNSLYTKTLNNKIQIENQLILQRDSLKSRIQQKMRKSQNNMLSYREKSNSSLSSRLKQQNKKIFQIKKMQKTMYNQKYQKSKQMSTQTQNFFKNLKQTRSSSPKQISIDTSYILKTRNKSPLFFAPKRSFNKNFYQRSQQKLSKIQNPQRSRTILESLKTPRSKILQKQAKKIQHQKAKQRSFLRQYVKKMQSIQKSRKIAQIERKIPQKTIPKIINRQYDEQLINKNKKYNKNSNSLKQAVNNKGSFSQLYNRKILQKKNKKSFFLSQSLSNGDDILKDEHLQTAKLKLNKLIRQSQNQLARKQNFKYMEKFLNKKL